jgi:hypothetical protein
LRTSSRLRDGGQPLRDAMHASGLGLEKIAAATKEIDPRREGVSFQLVAFLATEREWGRQTTTPISAALISRVLGHAEDDLFERVTEGDPDEILSAS